jgi:hypothetical protein
MDEILGHLFLILFFKVKVSLVHSAFKCSKLTLSPTVAANGLQIGDVAEI